MYKIDTDTSDVSVRACMPPECIIDLSKVELIRFYKTSNLENKDVDLNNINSEKSRLEQKFRDMGFAGDFVWD